MVTWKTSNASSEFVAIVVRYRYGYLHKPGIYVLYYCIKEYGMTSTLKVPYREEMVGTA
jgi:hypothetical protein